MCNCFICRNGKRLDLCKAYFIGYTEACKWFLNWAKKNNINLGYIGDNDLSGIYAEIKCNYDEANCILASKEFENIEM